jgi:DNA end-binding protein Ku
MRVFRVLRCTNLAVTVTEAGMAARAIWKGVIAIGKSEVPVKLYSVVEETAPAFHLLHDRDEVRVRQRMVNARTGKEPAEGAARKGYEVSPGTFVFIDEAELETLAPKASRTVELLRVMPAEKLGHAWYHRPYFLGPDGKATEYAALVSAIGERVGVVRWVMRGRRYFGALRKADGHLLVVTLRHPHEVVQAPDVEPFEKTPSPRELAMAEQLVAMLEGDFDPRAFSDEYRSRVLELVDAKAHGRTLHTRAAPRRRAPGDVAAALEASVKHLQKERRSA